MGVEFEDIVIRAYSHLFPFDEYVLRFAGVQRLRTKDYSAFSLNSYPEAPSEADVLPTVLEHTPRAADTKIMNTKNRGDKGEKQLVPSLGRVCGRVVVLYQTLRDRPYTYLTLTWDYHKTTPTSYT